jgi:hypothetical protein
MRYTIDNDGTPVFESNDLELSKQAFLRYVGTPRYGVWQLVQYGPNGLPHAVLARVWG